MFKGHFLQARLQYELGEMETAVSNLHAILSDYDQPKYQAEINFYLWQMTGEEGVRETAVSLYQTLLSQTPNYQYRQHLNQLLNAQE